MIETSHQRMVQSLSKEKTAEIKAPADAVTLGELPATAICGNDISSSCL
jgi:hypothetical protein